MKQKFSTEQAIILAAGESSRFWPINKKHKSLFKIMGKPLICRILENLKESGLKEVIIVQGVKKEIAQEVENCFKIEGLKIKYIIQKSPLGTGDALKSAEKYLKDKFLVLYGDDFYGVTDIKSCLTKFPSVLVKEVLNPTLFGVVVLKKNYVKGIVEKPKTPKSNLINAGCFHFPKRILSQKITKSERGEYEITDYFNQLAQTDNVYFSKAKEWFPLSYSWDLFNISEFLLKNLKTKIKGRVEKNCHIKKPVFIGKGTILKSGVYVEGPVWIGENCLIGPNCFLRPYTSIGDNCVIGNAVEIKNSIISSYSRIAHLSYVADSIIGENCNLGAGVILSNLRFDNKNIHSMIKGELIDTGRRKFGAVLGKDVKVGVNSSIMPGVLVGSDSIIGPNSLVKENVGNNEIFYSQFQAIIKKNNN
jgi:bifunctional UDP-N-acetylglucosamine pyrophosphorylase/glucosamine-1-phosphate N-acetyltransferase